MRENQLTDAEITKIMNLDKVLNKGRHFGQLQVKSVTKGDRYEFLNATKKGKYVGAIRADRKLEGVWWLEANGETYRVNEPKDGIDSRFDIEFKRVDL